ncbi:hypothetical protein HMP09_2702 [Sphingomonas sp. HMP9]|nr:hypothetical protein HMP09_2702 [Sphingomonas sp. HMP9]
MIGRDAADPPHRGDINDRAFADLPHGSERCAHAKEWPGLIDRDRSAPCLDAQTVDGLVGTDDPGVVDEYVELAMRHENIIDGVGPVGFGCDVELQRQNSVR